jgi:pimeloyl-ACP methyl ester carboxylesterase
MRHFFTPLTAYASQMFPDYLQIVTMEFSVVHGEPQPLGASNVLFLPGIQSSRLYKDNLFGSGRDRVWPPNAAFNEDIRDLRMNAFGASEEEIYTEDVIDSSTGVGDVYAGFITFLNQLKTDETIHDWTSFAYDWRYSVTNVVENGTRYRNEVKSVIAEVERLATNSRSGRVTLIGHSNGGLLAKAIMIELEAMGKQNLVDKVILLTSPQLGTPKAIGTILHGYDQTDSLGGFVMDGHVVREVINTMPGAYGLLPSQKYFEGLNDPLITFTDTTATAPYRAVYGESLTSYESMAAFLKGDGDGLERDLSESIATPARVHGAMLEDASAMLGVLDEWTAPQGVEVIEIVGTGMPTLKSVEYREIAEDKCASAGPAGLVCVTEHYIKPYAVLTKYGDGTVVQRSAEGYGGEKDKYFINLEAIENSSLDGEYVHYNITEASPLQLLIRQLLTNTSSENNQFISTHHTEFNSPYEIEMIDSPVRLLSTDTDGNQTGVVIVNGVRVIKQEIPGSQYFEFGDTKYFVVPKGTDRTTKLYGEAYGGYTLTTAELASDDVQIVKTVLQNASTSPEMVAEYSNKDGVFGSLTTDMNGDSVVDFETTLTGEMVEEDVVITYSVLISTIEELNLSKARKQALLLMVKSAEQYGNRKPKILYRALEDGLLKASLELVRLYNKKRYITSTDATALEEMITFLKDKQ